MGKIIGISGSTVKSGVLEKAMECVLEATGHEWELVRLHDIDLKHCTGCVACASTNRCVLKDDGNELLNKILEADAIVFGGVARFGKLNALSNAFFERLGALVHRKKLTNGKIIATVAGGFFNQQAVDDELSSLYEVFEMKKIDSLIIAGNISCFKCGYGEVCEYSLFRMKYGKEAKISNDVFYVFEKDQKSIEKANLLGKKISGAIAEKLKSVVKNASL